MKIPSPNLVLPLVGGALLTWIVHPGGEPSSLAGAAWSLIQLALVAIPFASGLNLLVKERRRDALSVLSGWAGAALTYLVLV